MQKIARAPGGVKIKLTNVGWGGGGGQNRIDPIIFGTYGGGFFVANSNRQILKQHLKVNI